MRRLTGKRFILGLIAVILCVTACAPAFASTGDRILMHQSTVDGYGLKYVESVLPCGNGLYMIVREDHVTTIERYADIHGEPEKFELESKNLDVAEDEEDVTTNTFVSEKRTSRPILLSANGLSGAKSSMRCPSLLR